MKKILLPLLSIFFSCSDQGVKIEEKTYTIPEAVLKKDSPSDFEQYNTFKKKTIETIDIEELGFYLSYNKMIINLTIKDKNSVIVFKKAAYKE